MVARSPLPWALQLLITTAQALPVVTFPINSQVPTVARISEPFSFVFSSSTFTSSNSQPLSYNLSAAPSWLSVDGSTRRLYGTPKDGDVDAGDVVGVPISLVASDGDGSTTLTATLVVSRNPAPTIKVPLSEQIANFGTFSAPSSILSYPDTSFSYQFAQDTFADTAVSELSYYAVMADNSPLPSWVSFSSDKLTFSGRTPPFASLIQPPQTFTLQLVASDVVGFSAVSEVFSIVVGGHVLTIDDPTVELNGTVGLPLNYTALRGNVKIDGHAADPSNITSITASNMPPWLSLDQDTWEIHGTPPSSAKSTAFSVVLADSFSDTLNVTFSLSIIDGAFRNTLPQLSFKPGEHIDFDLKPYLWDPSTVDVTAKIEPSTSWLSFDTSNLVLTGDVPKDGSKLVARAAASAIKVSFQVKSKTSDAVDTADMTIDLDSSAATSASSAAASSGTATPTSSSSAAASTTAPSGHGKKRASISTILLAVLLSLLFFSFLLSLALFCYRRRRQQKKRAKQLEGKHISEPLPGSFTFNGGMDAKTSMRALDKQYGIGYAQSANLRPGYSGLPRSLLRGLKRPENDLEAPRLPPIPPIVLDSPNPSASGNGVSDNSWLAPFRALTRRGPKRHSQLSRISDATSIGSHDFGFDSSLSMVPSVAMPGDGSHNTSRTHLGPHTPSIQHTPHDAYSAQGSDDRHWQDVYSANASSVTLSTPALMESRPISGAPSQGAVSGGAPHEGPSTQPWLRSNALKLLKHARGKKSLLSLSTIDTFADRVRGRRAPNGNRVFGPSDHQPIPDESRPVTRTGEEPVPQFGQVGSTPVEVARRDDLVPAPLRISTHHHHGPGPERGGGGGGAHGVDHLGISQANSAAATPSPSQPTGTWSTVESTDDWLEDISQRLDTAISDNEPNWQIIRDPSPPGAGRYRRGDNPAAAAAGGAGQHHAGPVGASTSNGSALSAPRSARTGGSTEDDDSFAVYI